MKVYLVRFFEKEKSHVSDRPASSGREGHALDTRQARNFSVPISPSNLQSFHWRNFESWQASVKNTATQSRTTVVLLRRNAVETTRLNVIYHRKCKFAIGAFREALKTTTINNGILEIWVVKNILELELS